MNIHEMIRRTIDVMYNILSAPVLDYRARRYLFKLKKKKTSKEKIDVLFIVQMPELWNKQLSVYETMLKNDYFNPKLLIIPKYDFVNKKIGAYGDELLYFRKYDKNALTLENINDIVLILKSYDYVFYQREYDIYLPPVLRCKNVIKYSKTCYIPYSTPEAKKTVLYGRQFYRNIYLGFLDSDYSCKFVRRKFKYNVKKDLQKFLYLGYPSFEKILNEKYECYYKNILWTPRWSYDSRVGGSHFFEYCDVINAFSKLNKDINVCIRPHPLMFENFIRQKMMTEEQVKRYKEEVIKSRAFFDSNKDIFDTFQSTDILISDISSVIPMYFLTGKPIIYCPRNIEYSWLFETIIPGLYIAENEEKLKIYLEKLTKGEDELKEIRQSILEMFSKLNENATNKIVNAIYYDFCIQNN